MRFLTLITVILTSLSQWVGAQLTVPAEVEPFDPIIVGCDCIVPEGADVRFIWSTDERSTAIEVSEGRQLHVWAAPGEHYVMAIVVIQNYTETQVFVPDPDFPGDITKATLKTIRVASGIDVQRYERRYKVTGATPVPPGPEPEPEPEPNPPEPEPEPAPTPDGLATQVREWLKKIPSSSYSKADAQAIGGNYQSVGSQGADPARNGGWTPEAFVEQAKTRNQQVIDVRRRSDWLPLFSGIAAWQEAELQKRGLPTGARDSLTQQQKQGYADLFTETGEAILKGAF